MRLFLGDQSVVITKDFSLYFEEADVCVRSVSSFEHTCSTSPPSTHEGFPLCLIPMDHSSVPQHLQTLGLSSPVHTASSLARRGRTSNNKFAPELETPRTHLSASSKYKERSLGDLNTLITNKHSHRNTPIE